MLGLFQEGGEAASGIETSVLTDVVLPLALALIMLGMGMGLSKRHFRLVVDKPRGVAAGLLGQLVLLPVAGVAVGLVAYRLFGLEAELALGLLLLAAVPGGATSNMLTWLARGDTALSVSLTAVTSLGSFLLTPLVLFASSAVVFGAGAVVSVSILQVLAITLGVIAVPVVLGMVLGHYAPRVAKAVDRPLRVFSIVFFVLLVAGIIFQNRVGFWGFAAATIPAALALNLLALGAGFLVARLFSLGEKQTRTAVIEVGFQNGTFAIFLAVGELGSARAALMPGFYSLLMYATGGLLAVWWARRSSYPAPSPSLIPRPARRPLPRTDRPSG